MEMPAAEGWPFEVMDSSIALSSDLEILEAETTGKTRQVSEHHEDDRILGGEKTNPGGGDVKALHEGG